MQQLRARVRNGRLVVDEPTDLPEGLEVSLVIADGDELDEVERAELHASLIEGLEDVTAGRVIDAKELIAELRSRRA